MARIRTACGLTAAVLVIVTSAPRAGAALISAGYSNALSVHGRVDIDADNTNEINDTFPYNFQSTTQGVGEGRQYSGASVPAGLFYGETVAQAASIYKAGGSRVGLKAQSESRERIETLFSNKVALEYSSDASAGLNIRGIQVIPTEPGLDLFLPVTLRFNFTLNLDGSNSRNSAANVFDGYAQTADVAVTFGDDSKSGHAMGSQFGGQGLNLQKSGVLSSLSSMDGTVTFSVEQQFIPAFGTKKDISISVLAGTYASGVYGPLAGNGLTESKLLADLTFDAESFGILGRGFVEAPAGYRIDSEDGILTDGEFNPNAFVPEPASLALMLAGALAAAGRRRPFRPAA
jgi:hypothetical protein